MARHAGTETDKLFSELRKFPEESLVLSMNGTPMITLEIDGEWIAEGQTLTVVLNRGLEAMMEMEYEDEEEVEEEKPKRGRPAKTAKVVKLKRGGGKEVPTKKAAKVGHCEGSRSKPKKKHGDKGLCAVCGGEWSMNADGTLRNHRYYENPEA